MARLGKRYTPNKAGLRELGQSRAVQNLAMEGARSIANAAQTIDSRGTYSARPAGVTAGWDNEMRAGAVVTDETGSGGRKQTLKQALGTAVNQQRGRS